jgi:ketosteroid isomerase-like protein
MNRSFASLKLLALIPVLALGVVRANAQAVPALETIKSQAQLKKAVATLDAALFDSYNHCDLKKFESFLADDIEFFHDEAGVMVGKDKVTEAVKENICGKVTRTLVPGTLEVFPMRGYGALEMGVHRFYHPGHNDTQPVGEARFIHLWHYQGGAWKITRVISYDHHALPK